MKKIIKNLLVLICFIIILILPYFVFAGNSALDKLKQVGSDNGPYEGADVNSIANIAGTGVSALLSFLGVIFMVLIIYAGYNWMTAQGDDEKVNKAKDTLTRAVTGLIIVLAAFAIWGFIYFRLIIK